MTFPGLMELPNIDVSYINDLLLDSAGLYQPVHAKELSRIPHAHLQVWALNNAIYQFCTIEMIQWLKKEIEDLSAIEICAGNGIIGRSLGIPTTDGYHQERPEIKALYSLMNQPVIKYPADVLKFEASEAVEHFKANCVIGAFVTQYGTIEGRNCNPFGPHETQIVKKVKKYIHFGNKITHANKYIYMLPHRELKFDWQFTRCAYPNANRVWIWEGQI